MAHRVNEGKIAWRVVDGEAVLLNADTSAYYGLNRTGTLLWLALAEEGIGTAHLSSWARSRFPDAPDQLSGDISGFLSQLQAFDLLEPATQESAKAQTSAMTTSPTDGYEPPQITPFGELEKLILSGE